MSGKKGRVTYNLDNTKYEVVRQACASMPGWQQVKAADGDDEDWDLLWTDTSITADRLLRMKPYQRVNHFVGTNAISRKNSLGRNLLRMKKYFPKAFKFFPQTWMLPTDYADFKAQLSGKKRNKTFIIKPEGGCQGRGIFLTRRYQDIDPSEHLVAQRYIHRPLLLEGLKFDIRLYVLVTGCSPLRVFIHQEGLVRLSTEAYVSPAGRNLQCVSMHLTNYSINKNNANFEQNTNPEDPASGHKRSLRHVVERLTNDGHDMQTVFEEIDSMVLKTLVAIAPSLSHVYNSCQPADVHNAVCFEILGFDVLLDYKLKPWLIEVNHSPSFAADSPLDKIVKGAVIRDALKLVNVTALNRKRYKMNLKEQLVNRLLVSRTPLSSAPLPASALRHYSNLPSQSETAVQNSPPNVSTASSSSQATSTSTSRCSVAGTAAGTASNSTTTIEDISTDSKNERSGESGENCCSQCGHKTNCTAQSLSSTSQSSSNKNSLICNNPNCVSFTSRLQTDPSTPCTFSSSPSESTTDSGSCSNVTEVIRAAGPPPPPPANPKIRPRRSSSGNRLGTSAAISNSSSSSFCSSVSGGSKSRSATFGPPQSCDMSVMRQAKAKMREEVLRERAHVCEEVARHRTTWEDANLGGYRRVYPDEAKTETYAPFFAAAEEIWQSLTGTAQKPKPRASSATDSTGVTSNHPSSANQPASRNSRSSQSSSQSRHSVCSNSRCSTEGTAEGAGQKPLTASTTSSTSPACQLSSIADSTHIQHCPISLSPSTSADSSTPTCSSSGTDRTSLNAAETATTAKQALHGDAEGQPLTEDCPASDSCFPSNSLSCSYLATPTPPTTTPSTPLTLPPTSTPPPPPPTISTLSSSKPHHAALQAASASVSRVGVSTPVSNTSVNHSVTLFPSSAVLSRLPFSPAAPAFPSSAHQVPCSLSQQPPNHHGTDVEAPTDHCFFLPSHTPLGMPAGRNSPPTLAAVGLSQPAYRYSRMPSQGCKTRCSSKCGISLIHHVGQSDAGQTPPSSQTINAYHESAASCYGHPGVVDPRDHLLAGQYCGVAASTQPVTVSSAISAATGSISTFSAKQIPAPATNVDVKRNSCRIRYCNDVSSTTGTGTRLSSHITRDTTTHRLQTVAICPQQLAATTLQSASTIPAASSAQSVDIGVRPSWEVPPHVIQKPQCSWSSSPPWRSSYFPRLDNSNNRIPQHNLKNRTTHCTASTTCETGWWSSHTDPPSESSSYPTPPWAFMKTYGPGCSMKHPYASRQTPGSSSPHRQSSLSNSCVGNSLSWLKDGSQELPHPTLPGVRSSYHA
eukprot:GHVQ01002829.1.p1 GENE.GHVQ01002829.1~~GHVQ01002829.1.p1  ORF type:complete len:1303 (+),score=238.81 GHVQ01002829.1:778-4686(+)